MDELVVNKVKERSESTFVLPLRPTTPTLHHSIDFDRDFHGYIN